MKNPIDLDALFDEKLAQYMEENAGKYTEKQWESIIPKLYKSFGDTFIKKLGDTPKGYYAKMSDAELVSELKAHVEKEISVPDFLCRELEDRGCVKELVPLILSTDRELSSFAVNIAGSDPLAFDAYFTLLSGSMDEDLKESVVEALKSGADCAKERALDFYEKGIERECMLEILSRCKQRDDRIFELLLTAFRTSPDELPMHASYLAAYGDERALPVLLEIIDRDETNYLEYQELKYAIEALGGEYTRVRDFSDDTYFQEIAAQSQVLPDFTGNDKKN